MLDIRNLNISAGDFSLQNINLAVREGEFNIILGPTGSGKTLLLETIAGLYGYDSGSIKIDDDEIGSVPVEKRGISYVPQDLALFPHMTVEQNIQFGAKFQKINDDAYLQKLIDNTNISNILKRYPANLSGGEKQRVSLVRALAGKPKLLLLDEPLSALHPQLRWDLQRLLKNMHSEFNLTMLMVSHDLEEALYLGDIISIIMNGKIQQSGRRKEVYYHPKTTGIARFFGIQNIYQGEIKSVDEDLVKVKTFEGMVLNVAKTHRHTSLVSGERISWGIHSEEVTIVKPERKSIERMNLLRGKITDIYERGRFYILIFQSGNGSVLEINIPDFALRKLDIQKDSDIEVELNEKKIFIFSDKQ